MVSNRTLTSSETAEVDLTSPETARIVITENDNPGSIGQVLTSRGPGQLPEYQDASTGGGTEASVNVQRFNNSGTWTAPAGFPGNSIVEVQMWGGGAAGQAGVGGGGGGEYVQRRFLLSQLNSTESVTVGLGGTSQGQTGGDSIFSENSANELRAAGGATPNGGGGFPSPSLNIFAGGRGGDHDEPLTVSRGQSVAFGGAGGGSRIDSSTLSPGGESVYGGNGGTGSNDSTPATQGQVPGGGGGGGSTFAAGADGRVDIITYRGG